jgi:RimJ/RimL family protein N-acetyltransferase
MTPIITITGDRIALGPLRRDLIPHYQRWINDFATLRNLGRIAPHTLEHETAWFDRVTQTDSEIVFTAYERATLPEGRPRPIGTAGLSNISYRTGRADFGIMIGEPDARGKGYGTETTRLVLDYAFTALGLRNVALTVAEWNVAGQRAYAKAGFREFGRRRQCWPMDGRWYDEVLMDCLASEFESPILKHIFAPDESKM